LHICTQSAYQPPKRCAPPDVSVGHDRKPARQIVRYLNRANIGSMTSSSGTDTNATMSSKAPIADNARSDVMT
jgi:hypothetical protein